MKACHGLPAHFIWAQVINSLEDMRWLLDGDLFVGGMCSYFFSVM